MADSDIAKQTDLSEGALPDETLHIGEDYLLQQRQKRTFRLWSFIVAWGIAALFLLSVLCFSYRLVHEPSQYWHISITSDQPGKDKPSSKTVTNKAADQTDSAENKPDVAGTLSPNGPINQILILLGLLSAVGTTLAISVMRFSFSNESKTENNDSNLPTSPVLTSISELVTALADTLRKDK